MAEAAAEAAKVVALSPAAASGGKAARDTHGLTLHLAKVKRIMKDNADVKTISTDSHFVLARATELFLGELAVRAHRVMQEDQQRKSSMLEYKDVATVVYSWDALEFLHGAYASLKVLSDMVPKKVPAAEVLAQLNKQQEQRQESKQNGVHGHQQQQEEEQLEQQDADDKDEQ